MVILSNLLRKGVLMLNKEKLKKYLDSGFNVLLEGTHGLGKTAIIKEVFESKGLNWKYFSASTMDPWIDFIGVPKTVTRNGQDVLELVKPQEFANDEVEAIFFDEFNRAPSKVVNAVMELIQFKSINGKKFNNLKVVWAAINPYDEEGTYSVEQIDAATKDRFHIQIQIPLELDTTYLIKTHGEISRPFIKWWNELPKDLKIQVSPRRLDYAIQVHNAEGDLRDVLISTSNVKKLEDYIKEMNKGLELSNLIKKSDKELKQFFTLENTIRYGEQILQNKKYASLVKYFHKDFIESNIQKKNGSKLTTLLIQEALQNKDFYDSLEKESQSIIGSVKKNNGIISNARVDYAIEKAITAVVASNIGRSVPMFMRKLYPVFETYFASLKSEKSTDIISFMELVFNAKDNNGLPLQQDVIKTLMNYKSVTNYTPDTDGQKLLLGMLLNFAIKYNKLNNQSTKELNEIIVKMNSVYIKNRNSRSSIENFQMILLAFNENNWTTLKEVIEKKTDWESITNTMKIREIIKVMKNKPENQLKYPEPTNIEKAKEIFSKQVMKIQKNLEFKSLELMNE